MANIQLNGIDECRNNPFKRLQVWVILTDSYGKPYNKYVDDFVSNFGADILDGKFKLRIENMQKILDENFLFPADYEFSGGFAFYRDILNLERKTIEELKEYIKNWTGAEDNSLRDEINSQLRHPIVIGFKSNRRSGYHCKVRYNPDKNNFTLLKGSKMADRVVESCKKGIIGIKDELINARKIDSAGNILEDIEFDNASTAANLISLANIGIYKYYLDNSAYKFIDILNDSKFYDKVMVELGYERATTEDNPKETTTEQVVKVAEDYTDDLEDKFYNEVAEQNDAIDWSKLEHSVILSIHSDEDDDRDYIAGVMYDAIKKRFIVLKGAKIAKCNDGSCPSSFIARVSEFKRQGTIGVNDRTFQRDVPFTNPDDAFIIIALKADYHTNIFVGDTPFKLIRCLENDTLYRQFISRK